MHAQDRFSHLLILPSPIDPSKRSRGAKTSQSEKPISRKQFELAITGCWKIGNQSKAYLKEESFVFVPDGRHLHRGTIVCQACGTGVARKRLAEHCFGKSHIAKLEMWNKNNTNNALLKKHVVDGGNKFDVGVSISTQSKSNITVNSFKHFAPIMEKVFIFNCFYCCPFSSTLVLVVVVVSI